MYLVCVIVYCSDTTSNFSLSFSLSQRCTAFQWQRRKQCQLMKSLQRNRDEGEMSSRWRVCNKATRYGTSQSQQQNMQLCNYDATLVKWYMLIVQSTRNPCYFRIFFNYVITNHQHINITTAVFHSQDTFQTQRYTTNHFVNFREVNLYRRKTMSVCQAKAEDTHTHTGER